MKLRDYIKFRTRSNVGADRLEKIVLRIKSEEFSKSTPNQRILYLSELINNKDGLSYKEMLDNPEILADIILSISDSPEAYRYVFDNLSLPQEINKKLLPVIIQKLAKPLSNMSDDYLASNTINNIIHEITYAMAELELPETDKLDYAEDSIERFKDNPIALASILRYFDSRKQYEISYPGPFQYFEDKKNTDRLEKIIDYAKKSFENNALAKEILSGVYKSNKININRKDEEDNSALLEKINILQNLRVQNVPDFINNKEMLELFSVEQIARLSLDKGLIAKALIIAYDKKKSHLLKEFLKRPNSTNEITDFLTNIEKYYKLIQNTSLEDLEKSRDISDLIDIIVSDQNNMYNIDSLSDVKAYNIKRFEYCISIISGKNIEQLTEEEFIESINSGKSVPKDALSQKKEALYQLLFGLTATQVENIVKKYGEDVFKKEMASEDISIKDAKTIEILKALRRLYEAEDVNKICQGILSNKNLLENLKNKTIITNYASLESIFIELYNNRINDVLYNPNKGVPVREVTYEGQPSEYPARGIISKIFKRKDRFLDKAEKMNWSYGMRLEGLFDRKKKLIFPTDSAKGRHVSIYELDPSSEFNILGRVDGAYLYGYREPFDFSNNDIEFNLAAHGNCKSFISNDLLAIATCDDNSGPIFGYYNQDANELMMMAPWDIASGSANYSYAPQRSQWNLNRGIQFRLPKFMKNYTRHNHNELVYDRLLFDERLKQFKKDKPQFVIYIKDFDENTIIDDLRWEEIVREYGEEFALDKNVPIDTRLEKIKNISEKTGKPLEELVYDDKYRQTIKAAAQFNIPVLIIDKLKVIESEQKKVNDSLNQIIREKDINKLLELIPNIITSFENNANSVRYASNKIRNTYFTDELRKQLFEIIKRKIEQIENENPINGKKVKQAYEDALLEEEQKYISNTGLFLRGCGNDTINKEILRIKESRNERFSAQELPRLIKEISSLNYYDNNKSHSIEHIQRVMIFADKIASKRYLSVEMKKILIAACAFHDSGRGKDKDGNDVHGAASAFKVQEYFEKNPNNPFGITADNLSIIQAIIEFHEIPDKDRIKGNIKFVDILKKYNINPKECSGFIRTNTKGVFIQNEYDAIREMANILKDADALDRFRFPNEARLDPTYLRTRQSKKLIGFAKVMNAKFASKVLDEVYHATPEQLKGHRKVSSLKYFRQLEQKRNADYIEPHIPLDILLTEVYDMEIPQNEEKEASETTITFEKRRRDLCMYDDLTPMEITDFLSQLSKVALKLRGKNFEEGIK